MRELWLEMWHDIHPDAKLKFVTKGISDYIYKQFQLRISNYFDFVLLQVSGVL